MKDVEFTNLHGSVITMPGRPYLGLDVIDYEMPTRSSKEIPTTTIASTVETSVSAKVVDEGELALSITFKPGSTDPANLIPHADEVILVTFPLRTDLGHTVAATARFKGHITKATGPKGDSEGRATRSITIKVNSKPLLTRGS